MFTLTAKYLYLSYLEACLFCPQASEHRSPVSHFILIRKFSMMITVTLRGLPIYIANQSPELKSSHEFIPSCSRTRMQIAENPSDPSLTITDADYADDIALLANTPNNAEFLWHSLDQEAVSIGHHVNADNSDYKCFDIKGDICQIDGGSLKLIDKLTYFGSSVSYTEIDINMHELPSIGYRLYGSQT